MAEEEECHQKHMRDQAEAERVLEDPDKVLAEFNQARDARGSLASQPQPPQGSSSSRTGETG